jgi:predicted enzyme related to lactoylglutathione lyase
MPNARFARYILRTTDVSSAQAFYRDVLGLQGDYAFPLHEQALARGARPHWLGHIDVADPATAAAPLLAAGGQQLGERPDGVVVLRDPGGALLALGGVHTLLAGRAARFDEASKTSVVYHVLRARNADGLAALYAELFGWSLGERFALNDGEQYRALAFQAGEPSVGAAGELSAGVHPQWLFFFAVDSLADAVAKVREHGAVVIGPSTLPSGAQCAVCDDPQGAAFGMMQR